MAQTKGVPTKTKNSGELEYIYLDQKTKGDASEFTLYIEVGEGEIKEMNKFNSLIMAMNFVGKESFSLVYVEDLEGESVMKKRYYFSGPRKEEGKSNFN